jgi:hypothetical protein
VLPLTVDPLPLLLLRAQLAAPVTVAKQAHATSTHPRVSNLRVIPDAG